MHIYISIKRKFGPERGELRNKISTSIVLFSSKKKLNLEGDVTDNSLFRFVVLVFFLDGGSMFLTGNFATGRNPIYS